MHYSQKAGRGRAGTQPGRGRRLAYFLGLAAILFCLRRRRQHSRRASLSNFVSLAPFMLGRQCAGADRAGESRLSLSLLFAAERGCSPFGRGEGQPEGAGRGSRKNGSVEIFNAVKYATKIFCQQRRKYLGSLASSLPFLLYIFGKNYEEGHGWKVAGSRSRRRCCE